MVIETYKCNYCSKTTHNRFKTKGWIFIDGRGLHLSNENKTERYYANLIAKDDSLDFCSMKCFIHWILFSKDTDNKNSKKGYSKFSDNLLEDLIKNLEEPIEVED